MLIHGNTHENFKYEFLKAFYAKKVASDIRIN